MHIRHSALIVPVLTALLAPAALQPASASQSAQSHHYKKHHAASDTASDPAPRPSHASRHEKALLAKLRAQEEQLYALRHERNVFSARSKQLAQQLAAKRARRLAAKKRHQQQAVAETQAVQPAKTASAKVTRGQRLQALRQAKAQQQAAHLAKLHELHLAMQQAHAEKVQKLHEARVAIMQAHEAKMRAQHLARIAQQEAQREQHKDKPNSIVKVASGSGLPIWQGNAYAAQVPVKIVTVDLNDTRVKVSALLSQSGIGTSEPFTHMISRTHPSVAVTGTFFSLDNLRPVGDIVIDGSLAYFGGMGTALAITSDNRADMITVPWGHHHNWSGYETVIACGPRLLKDGQVVLDPHMEHFKDRHMLSPNSRIAVGITGHNQLVFVMTRDSIYLGRLAKVMQSLGCKQAMNLDAGTSTGFYCNGNLMARPGRRLTNAIVVYSRRVPAAEQSAHAMGATRRHATQQLAAGRAISGPSGNSLRTVASVELRGDR